RCHVEDLGLAPLEEPRAVGGRDDADLGAEGPDVARSPTVDAHAVLDDAPTNQLLGKGPDGSLHLALTPAELLLERARDRGPRLVVAPGVLGAAGLDHHDGDVPVAVLPEGPTGDDQLEGGLVTLLVGRVRYPASVLGPGDANGPDGAVERDARDHQRR